MINRSKIKYSLKNLLPKVVFSFILELWQKILIKFVEEIDKLRLQKFITCTPVKISYGGQNFSLFISPQNGFIDKHIYLYGTYEPQILDVIAKYLKKGSVLVDIGANIGQHSMFSASIVGNTGKIYSFEPIPYVYNQLLDSIKINRFEDIITTHNVALGKETKTETLYIETNNVGGSSIVRHHGKEAEKITIDVRRGDDLLGKIPHINMIKIDVEGYENEVLAGMYKTLIKHRPVIILEFSGKLYFEKGRNDGDDIISLLQNIGYDLYDIEDYMKKITSREDFLAQFEQEKVQCDLLCLPRNSNYEI